MLTVIQKTEVLDCGDAEGNRYQVWATIPHPEDTTRVASMFVCSCTDKAMADHIAKTLFCTFLYC